MRPSDFCNQCFMEFEGLYCPRCTKKNNIRVDSVVINEGRVEINKRPAMDTTPFFSAVQDKKLEIINRVKEIIHPNQGVQVSISIGSKGGAYLYLDGVAEELFFDSSIFQNPYWNWEMVQNIANAKDLDVIRKIFPYPSKVTKEWVKINEPELLWFMNTYSILEGALSELSSDEIQNMVKQMVDDAA